MFLLNQISFALVITGDRHTETYDDLYAIKARVQVHREVYHIM